MASDEMQAAEESDWAGFEPPPDVLRFVSTGRPEDVLAAIRQAHRAGFAAGWNRRAEPPASDARLMSAVEVLIKSIRDVASFDYICDCATAVEDAIAERAGGG